MRIKEQTNVGNLTMGIYYRPPDQEEKVDEALYKQLEVTSQFQLLVLKGDFNKPEVC